MPRTPFLAALGLAVWAAAGAPPAGADDGALAGLRPATPAPPEDALRPGLAVTYYAHKFNHVDEVVDWADYRDGRAGAPVPVLDYQVGDGDVLTSGRHDLVGALITGYLRFPEPGAYAFVVESNDGVEVRIGGRTVLFDPDVHFDRFSEIAAVQIDEAGWYDLFVVYFEKKSTSTLRLFWNTPGEDGEMAIVPAEHYAHLPQ